LLFGFFHETSRGWRTPNSLAFRLDGNTAKYWVFYEYGTRNGRTGCEGCFQGDRYQTTPTPPFRADGSEHAWTLAYQPRPTGDGLLTFTLDRTARTIVVPAEHRNDGAEFNRFGLINQQASGSGMEVWFSELSLEHQKLELSQPGTWIGSGNKVEFVDRADRPFHDFHWSATNRMGGKDGEIGGVIWRDEKPAYYADQVGPLTLQNELFASGRVTMHSAGADSALFLGWFDSASKTNKTTPEISEPQPNLLGILIEGPSSVGHYFRPMWRSSGKLGHLQDSGAIIKPDGQPHRWSIHYQPRDANGQGTITVTLDAASQTVPVPAEHQAAGARFDRFGIGNLQVGGLHIDFSLDDLRYTAEPR
jgi:hypothetical protein